MAIPKFLRHIGNGSVWPYTKELAKRNDMVAYDPNKGHGVFPSDPKTSMAEGGKNTPSVQGPDFDDPNRLLLIAAAIDELEDGDFTRSGAPQVDALNRVLGWANTVGKDERDAAYKLHKGGSHIEEA